MVGCCQHVHQGPDAIIIKSEVWSRYILKSANDNNRFKVTWFDDLDKSPAKEETVKGLIGAEEFSLWVAKPSTVTQRFIRSADELTVATGAHVAGIVFVDTRVLLRR